MGSPSVTGGIDGVGRFARSVRTDRGDARSLVRGGRGQVRRCVGRGPPESRSGHAGARRGRQSGAIRRNRSPVGLGPSRSAYERARDAKHRTMFAGTGARRAAAQCLHFATSLPCGAEGTPWAPLELVSPPGGAGLCAFPPGERISAPREVAAQASNRLRCTSSALACVGPLRGSTSIDKPPGP